MNVETIQHNIAWHYVKFKVARICKFSFFQRVPEAVAWSIINTIFSFILIGFSRRSPYTLLGPDYTAVTLHQRGLYAHHLFFKLSDKAHVGPKICVNLLWNVWPFSVTRCRCLCTCIVTAWFYHILQSKYAYSHISLPTSQMQKQRFALQWNLYNRTSKTDRDTMLIKDTCFNLLHHYIILIKSFTITKCCFNLLHHYIHNRHDN